MKLNTKALRHLSSEDWRVLTATEMGSRNHELVPTPLIIQIAGLRSGSSVHKNISTLAKANLISKMKEARYDGYRLTYGGLDYLALNAHRKASTVYSLGNQIGVGKESDIYVCASPSGRQLVLKIHRLGRISFRTVKANRDYLRHRSSGSWMYMSRLAAQKEYAFMQILRENGFPVPEPVGWNRHTVVMDLIDGFPLRQIRSMPEPEKLYGQLMEMILRLARYGLIHGDFNEFNILIEEKEKTSAPTEANPDPEPQIELVPTLIDFPQMLSTSHKDAEFYFNRDVDCIKRFFQRMFSFSSDEPGPSFADAMAQDKSDAKRLDVEVQATGFSKKMAGELEGYMRFVGVDGDAGGVADVEDEDDDEDIDEYTANSDDDAQVPNVEQSEPTNTGHTRSDLASEMTVLDIQDDTASISDFTIPMPEIPTAPSRTRKPKTSAKASSGFAI
ncbi:RIO1-domain-containing protein [Aulographum hederae CBS 113979]|uniref:Serine/threonine-protein kinase RIO2 n=1 Tax=Aulographum hederae CBS 113979 TaxID=1176131 RepID=A0A6G1GWD5_9PEZI|nr:RIO1-domain-containing protein [Aulographum hederae CBS 113979]